MKLRDEALTRHVLDVWKKAGKSSFDCWQRGQQLISWAWQARGSGFADTVTPEGFRLFEERLKEARGELDEALKLNPDSWLAHTDLINVARGLGLPREFMERHFREAVRLCPGCHDAWSARFEYLRPRWHGTPEDMLALGRECLTAGPWEGGVPPLALQALLDATSDTGTGATLLRRFQDDVVWGLVRALYRSSQQARSRKDRLRVLSYVALWGNYGGHYDEAAVALQKLEVADNPWREILGGHEDVQFLRTLVHARTGRLPVLGGRLCSRERAAAVAALAEGNTDEAERCLRRDQPEPGKSADQQSEERKGLLACRRLLADKRLELTPEELRDQFHGGGPRWEIDDTRATIDLAKFSRMRLTCPFGMKTGVVTATLEWTGNPTYVDVLAHPRAVGDRLILRYWPERRVVQLLRNYRVMNMAALPRGPHRLRIEFRGDADFFEPCAGVRWEAALGGEQAGGFAIEAGAAEGSGARLSLIGVRMELTD
jgi:hypothetical protein